MGSGLKRYLRLMTVIFAVGAFLSAYPIGFGRQGALFAGGALAAGNGNHGNSGGGAGGTGNSGGNGNGSTASALGGLNAAHASATAFENASPDSRVGKLDAFGDANLTVSVDQKALLAAQQTLANDTTNNAPLTQLRADQLAVQQAQSALTSAVADAQSLLAAAANKTPPDLSNPWSVTVSKIYVLVGGK